MDNILKVKNHKEFRTWLKKNHDKEKECFVKLKRGKPVDNKNFWYLDAVEEALCFGWIDSTLKKINGVSYQRFSPRKKNSVWTELNIERVNRLEKLGLMTEAGREFLPKVNKKFIISKEVETALKKGKVLDIFKKFPLLYQRVRNYNVMFYKNRDDKAYKKALEHLVTETKKGKMFGNWNDYGRLLDY